MTYFDKGKNQEERLAFVKKWAEYVRTHPDKDWSEQQRVLIDSQLQSAKQKLISVKDYLKIKEGSRKKSKRSVS